MKKPIDYEDGDQCEQLCREILQELTSELLADNAAKHDGLGAQLREVLVKFRNMVQDECGISSREFGLLLILNGLSAVASDEQLKRIQENQ